jgi:cyclophilin family peptidyl-prolyl cis-trans isomerase
MAKFLKKTLCGVLALAATVSSVGLFTACETKKPEVEIQLEFDGTTYKLDYTLYREVAPSTVAHFLALAENGYYDGLCVHDYSTMSLKTGVYSYTEGGENGGLVYKNYYEIVKSDDFKNFSHSVWQDENKEVPLYTLYGEFSSNKFTVTNGALKQSFGSLAMYYNEKRTDARVAVNRADGDGVSWREYKYNSVTSAFTISLDTTEKAASAKYCTFAQLGEDGKEELEALVAAIQGYITSNYGSEASSANFVNPETVTVDTDDAFVGEEETDVEFKIPKKEIKIKKVKVKKY